MDQAAKGKEGRAIRTKDPQGRVEHHGGKARHHHGGAGGARDHHAVNMGSKMPTVEQKTTEAS